MLDVGQPASVITKPRTIFIPVELMLVIGFIGFTIWRRRRR